MGTLHSYSAVQDDAFSATVPIEMPICTADFASQFSPSGEGGFQSY